MDLAAQLCALFLLFFSIFSFFWLHDLLLCVLLWFFGFEVACLWYLAVVVAVVIGRWMH